MVDTTLLKRLRENVEKIKPLSLDGSGFIFKY